jgi:homoserine kinase
MNKVTIRVPATSANLGPGFDCLGLALDLHNRVTVDRAGAGISDAMVGAAADAFFAAAGLPAFAYGWSIEADIPRSRGLGSSVAVRLGILHGLNELAGRPLDAGQVYLICAKLEGHPDNAAPAAFGGFAAARPDGTYFAVTFLRTCAAFYSSHLMRSTPMRPASGCRIMSRTLTPYSTFPTRA